MRGRALEGRAARTVTALVVLALVATGGLQLAAAGIAGSTDARTGCRRGTFADYHDQGDPGVIPDGYRGPVFDLSQHYPDLLPPDDASLGTATDVRNLLAGDGTAARTYLDHLFRYALAGNVAADWVPAKNSVRHWFHTPWLDTSADGREFTHGLTHELDSTPGLLGPDQSQVAQTWAVGLYNARGAWGIGQVWCDPGDPDPAALNPDNTRPNSFPDGTVVVKLLFTTASDTELPFLHDTFEWKADIFTKPSDGDPNSPSNGGDPPRSLQTVRLIQVDLAARDSRLPLGWAFGTYAYDGTTGRAGFAGLEPVGLSWGNSPGVTATMARETPVGSQWLNEQLIASGHLSDLHLGWGRRLSGPLDNPQSSCMSCHQTAGTPAAPLVPEASPAFAKTPPTEAQRLAWFNDIPAGSLFSPDQVDSLDYSLQLTIGIQRFLLAKCDPRARHELVSARGPDRQAPAAALPRLCGTVLASGTEERNWVFALVTVLAIGAVAAWWFWRRREEGT